MVNVRYDGYIAYILHRGKDEVIRHLMDLGFAPGAEVLVVGENVAGMILMVKGVRVALDRGLASKIMVA